MKFIDEATIEVKAGSGGSGVCHFRREKYVPYGGPDGGNGGSGGSVILIADTNKHTLLDFKFKPKWEAEDGRPGAGRRKDGKSGRDLIVRVPVGTQILETDSGELVADLSGPGQEFVLAKGGRGGLGNAAFKSATNRAPEKFQPGEEGTFGSYLLSLKLVADVGLIGMPNAGKSTLISRISKARPKIADYPFTTLTPNLGVAAKGGTAFVVADIPGLIPGAHAGKGLGIQFLKHVERTKLLVHLVDVSAPDNGEFSGPLDAYRAINKELASYSNVLAGKKQIIALSKIDAVSDLAAIAQLKSDFSALLLPVVEISSVSGQGLDELISEIVKALKALPEN